MTASVLLRFNYSDGGEILRRFEEFPVRFGRGSENDVVLDDQNISRTHAELLLVDGQTFIRDCQSINGIRLNGEIVMDAAVNPGDRVRLGECEFQVVEVSGGALEGRRSSDEIRLRPEGTGGVLEVIRAIDLNRSGTGKHQLDEGFGITPPVSAEEVRDRFQKLTQAYNNLLVIMNLISSVGNYSHPEQVCEQFVTALKTVFPLVENVAVIEVREDNEQGLAVLHQQGFSEPFNSGSHPSRTVLKRVIEEMRAVYAVDARRDPRYMKSDSVLSRGVRSMMCAPLIARGEVNGAIYVENLTQPYCFGLFDLNFLSIFTFHLGIALETARLLADRDRAFERAAEAVKAVRQDKTALLIQYSQSEKKFRALFEQSALGAAVINLVNGGIEEVNEGIVKMLGYSRRQLASMEFHQLLTHDDRPHAEEWLRHVRQHGDGSFKAHLLTSTGDHIVAQQSCRALRVGDVQVMLAYFIDITAKERAEAETRTQLQRVTALSELSQALMKTMDSDAIFQLLFDKVHVVLPVDRFHVALLDDEASHIRIAYSAQRASSDRTYNRGAPVAPIEGYNPSVVRVISGQETLVVNGGDDSRTAPPAGQPFHLPEGTCLPSSIFAPFTHGNRTLGIICVESSIPKAYDASHIETLRALVAQAALAYSNARAFESIRDQQENLRRLSLQIMTAQETERGRISRELHDGVGQQLTAMKYILESIRGAARSGDSDKLVSRVGEASELATQIIEDLRAISLDLRPTMLDDLGLKPTLEWFIRQYSMRYEIPVEFVYGLSENRYPPEVSTAVYRIVQEALGNVAKHAKAQSVSVRLLDDAGDFTIEVKDDGLGFREEQLSQKQALQGCSGMLNMKERAHFLGGDFRVETAPGKGTKLYVIIPHRTG